MLFLLFMLLIIYVTDLFEFFEHFFYFCQLCNYISFLLSWRSLAEPEFTECSKSRLRPNSKDQYSEQFKIQSLLFWLIRVSLPNLHISRWLQKSLMVLTNVAFCFKTPLAFFLCQWYLMFITHKGQMNGVKIYRPQEREKKCQRN